MSAFSFVVINSAAVPDTGPLNVQPIYTLVRGCQPDIRVRPVDCS
jgi:hypothetical protein